MKNPFSIVGALLALVGVVLLAVALIVGGDARTDLAPMGIFFVPFGLIFFFVAARSQPCTSRTRKGASSTYCQSLS